MCTSGKNAKGSCFGDSGGPAIVKNDAGFYVQVRLFDSLILFLEYYFFIHKTYKIYLLYYINQVGIVSFGGGICEEGYPSGQVLVHKFSDWIEAVTGLTF